MKKYFIPFLAVVFTGSFDAIAAAAESHVAGSGAGFTETETEQAKNLTLTDASGNLQTLTPDDAIVAIHDANGGFLGYEAVKAAEVALWQEVPQENVIAAPAAQEA
jgi:hypothetical protein